jgi:hypothetical protein
MTKTTAVTAIAVIARTTYHRYASGIAEKFGSVRIASKRADIRLHVYEDPDNYVQVVDASLSEP